jgi:hypothetical protein
VTITLDARQFSTVTHAGTVSDPWPGSAILSALMALPATGGTVMVADGVWKIDSLLQLNGVNNFNLVGQSLNAQLMFTGAGQMWFGSAGGVSNATISTLTINANTLTMASPQFAMRISNAQNFSFNNNQILGHQNNSIPAVDFEGGSNNQFLNNTITAGPQGGNALQLQALGGTPNSGFVISQNTFDSSGLLLIGLNNTEVTNNYFSNRTLGNNIGIDICGPWTGTSQNITIDGNTLDASIGTNGAMISGIPQDPGGTSNIDGLFITNNILKGTGTLIAVQSRDPSNFTDNSLIGSNKTNVTITGNQLSSLWVGSSIDIRGGAGSVDNVLVQSNTLQNSAGVQNVVREDAHTTNATISLEPIFQQDLNGDGSISPIPPSTVIEAFGSTSLVGIGLNYFLYPVGGSSGPELSYSGVPVAAGQFGSWTPIGAEQTANGYDVAWTVPGADQFSVWATDSSGNYTSNILGAVAGTSSVLESLEPVFQQDLNGDGSIGLLVQAMASFGPSGTLVNSSGALLGTDPSQQSTLSAPIDQHLAHA